VEVLLGNGWYKGRYNFDPRINSKPYYGTTWKLIAEIHITRVDGSREVVCTDESWKVPTVGLPPPLSITASILTRHFLMRILQGPLFEVFYERPKTVKLRVAKVVSFCVVNARRRGVYKCHYDRLLNAQTRFAGLTPPVGGSASIRLGRSLRSFPQLIPAHLGGTKPYRFLYDAVQTS
jgi:hypothetical protein